MEISRLRTMSRVLGNLDEARLQRRELAKASQDIPEDLHGRIKALQETLEEFGIEFPPEGDVLEYVQKPKVEEETQSTLTVVSNQDHPELVA